MTVFTIIAVVISSVVVLITLAKITCQQDKMIASLGKIEKKLSALTSIDDISSSRIQSQLHDLQKKINLSKGDVDWKG